MKICEGCEVGTWNSDGWERVAVLDIYGRDARGGIGLHLRSEDGNERRVRLARQDAGRLVREWLDMETVEGEDGEPVGFAPATYVVTVDGNGVRLRRLHDGQVVEAYPAVPPEVGAVYLAAISQGLQPPRDCRACEKPLR